jgi:hypothetical protein
MSPSEVRHEMSSFGKHNPEFTSKISSLKPNGSTQGSNILSWGIMIPNADL